MANPLIVKFAADTEAGKRAVTDLAATIAGRMADAGLALRSAYQNVQVLQAGLGSVATVAKGALVAFLAFKAITFAIDSVAESARKAREELKGMLEIQDRASRAGVGTTALQGAAGVQGGEAALTSLFSASQRRLGTGEGENTSPLEDALKAHREAGNITEAEQAGILAAQSQEERARRLLDLLNTMQSRAQDLAALDLAGKIFGADFEARMRQGVDAITELRRGLQATSVDAKGGRIISPEEIKTAQQINAELQRTESIYANALAPIQRDLAEYRQKQALADAEFNRVIAETVGYVARLYEIFQRIGSTLESLGNSSFWKRVNEAAAAWGIAGNWGGTGAFEAAPPGGFQAFGPPIPAGYRDPSRAGGGTDQSKRFRPRPGTAQDDTEDRTSLERYVDQLSKANNLAQAEVENIGKSNAEREVALALVRARAAAEQDVKAGNRDDAKLTSDEILNIQHLAEVYSRAKDAALDLKQAQHGVAEAARFAGATVSDALGDMIFQGARAADVVRRLAETLGRAGLNALFTGTGPLASILGTAAPASSQGTTAGGLAGLIQGLITSTPTPGRAAGGDVQAGRAYAVGEMGRELFVPDQNGRVIPIAPGAAAGAAGGLRVIVNNNAPVDVGQSFHRGPEGPELHIQIEELLGGLVDRGALDRPLGRRLELMGRG